MNYFLHNLFCDWKVYALMGLAAIVALNVMDVISYMLIANGFFNLWVVKSTISAAIAGSLAYGYYLHRREKRSRQLDNMLPAFLTDRHIYLEKMVAADPGFQTFCHECRHYDVERRRCLLRLHERKVRIKLQHEDIFSYCLYWNLEEHPILELTEWVKELQEEEKTEGEKQKENAESLENGNERIL